MLVVFSSYKIYFLYITLYLLEIYLLVKQSQDILEANEKEVTEIEFFSVLKSLFLKD